MNKKLVLLVSAFWLAALACHAQIQFKTADEESGILKPYGTGFNLGFDFGEDEAIFNYVRSQDSSYTPPGGSLTSAFKSWNLKLTLPVEENAHAILEDGGLVPALGLSFEKVWNKDQMAHEAWFGFYKFSYEMGESKFGRVDANTDSIFIDEEVSFSFSFVPGLNWMTSTRNDLDNLIVGFSFPLRYKINPTDDLRKKEYITDYDPGANGLVIDSEEAYSTTLDDFFSITVKVDAAFTPWLTTDDDEEEIGARFGFLGSFAARHNFMDSKTRCSLSFGPSVHPKYSTSAVIASLQAEFIDFNNSSGDKDFSDIFSVKFYVGLPLQRKD